MYVVKFSRYFSIAAIALSLSACDVVDLDKNGNPIIPMSAEEAASLKNMTPKALAEKFWGQVLSEAQETQITLTSLTDKKDANGFVRLSGQIESVDDTKKAATMVILADGQQVVVQIGPIIRGNAVRDSASFINFDDFKNQVQFARLSKELNKKAMSNFSRPDATWVGNNIEILAALTVKNAQVTEAIPLSIERR